MHAARPEIVRRRVVIDYAAADVANWSPNNKDRESEMNSLSSVFPAGEAFFVRSVRLYMDRIDDPVLREQAVRFIHQEAMHSREHARCNKALEASRPGARTMASFADPTLAVVKAVAPKATQLAVSCALEHFTAIFADWLLRRRSTFAAQCDPAFAALWLWHAAEEIEHKAVCFDVYRHVCGAGPVAYAHRIAIMAITSVVFVAIAGVAFAILRRRPHPRGHAKPRSTGVGSAPPRRSAPGLRSFLTSVSWRIYFDYYRPSFHPWNHDNAALVDEWRRWAATNMKCYADE